MNKFKFLIGLGNPGKGYTLSRHNTGFLFLDFFKDFLISKGYQFVETNKKEYSMVEFFELDLTLFKSLTFMNNSGIPLKNCIKYRNNFELSEMLLIHDDLDLKLGSYKLSQKSPKQHNGIISVEKELGTKDFYRLRIGTETRIEKSIKESGKDYVLSDFSKDELIILNESFRSSILDLFNL